MAKRPQGLLLPSERDRSADHDIPTPTSQSHSEGWHSQTNSESFTGWPWSVRHDYQQLRVGSSSGASQAALLETVQLSHASRNASWEQGYNDEENLLLGKVGLATASSRKLQQYLAAVVLLNTFVIFLEAVFISQQEVKRIVKLLQLLCVPAFAVLVLRMIRLEVTSFGDHFTAKQVESDGNRKEEMMCVMRTYIADLREAVSGKHANLEKEIAKRFSKADAAIAFAKAEAAAMRRQLEAAQEEAEAARAAADAANDRLAELEHSFAGADANGLRAPEEQPSTIMAALKEKVFGGGSSVPPTPPPAAAPVFAPETEPDVQLSTGEEVAAAAAPAGEMPPDSSALANQASEPSAGGNAGDPAAPTSSVYV